MSSRYLVKVEGTSPQITEAGTPGFRFFMTRAVKAASEPEAKAAAISLVAREWAKGPRKIYRVQALFKVAEIRPAGLLEAWWRGRGGYEFHSS